MDTSQIKQTILRNAEEISRMHAAVHETRKDRNECAEANEAWTRAAAEFRNSYDALAFPGGNEGALKRIMDGDEFAMETAVCFLELRPFFFRSGYMFKDILRKCRKAPLSAGQRDRLQKVEAAVIEWRLRRTALANTPETRRSRQIDRGN